MSVWLVVWVVLMILWLIFGTYVTYDPANPRVAVGTSLIPWACVLILGLFLFKAI